jgi:hypothetical protein
MTYLTEDERTALQASHKLSTSARARRAGELVNPASGLANDYLNRFNEIVMLIEQLPIMPELIDDIMTWRPISYIDYFKKSVLPGSVTALEAYEKLDARFRKSFEAIVEELDRRSTGSVVAVRRKFKTRDDDNGVALAEVCERAGANIREVLERATMLVNHGAFVSRDAVQERTDALMMRLSSQRRDQSP